MAVNVAALGAHATLIGSIGKDEAAETLTDLLCAQGVRCCLAQRPGRATVTKLRVVSRRQQLIRLDFEDGGVGAAVADDDPAWRAALSEADVVVFSDYGKGTLVAIPDLLRRARASGKPVLVDPKGKAFARYQGASVLSPNLAEFEAVVGECQDLDTLVSRGRTLCRELMLDALVVTRGELGMTLLEKDRASLHFPSCAREVYDVTGAGDTVVAVLAATLAVGRPLSEGTALANAAAGLVVGKMGTAAVSATELHDTCGDRTARGVLDESMLLERVASARAAGETVVMTNGCFDILHAGHVRYLRQARALGDRLVVAVNDDASVNRLKGRDRPINPLSRRMAVLDALESVDWVVPFGEDTPERLIGAVSPDILVKGGDYRPEAVAGADYVQSQGGRVVVLGYEQGTSTSGIIDTIQRSVQPSEDGAESG